jgi:PadR family transcriptional regulator PadR
MQEPALWILTALADGPKYGYGLITSVDELSESSVTLRMGTLYTALDRLVAQGLVENDRDEVVDGRNRRYYRLSDKGGALLAEETERLRLRLQASSAQLARRRRTGLGEAAGA